MKYPNHLKAQNQNKPEVEENLKENLKNKDRTHQKPKRQMKLIHMKTLTITITMPQVRVEAADLIMVKVATNNLEGLYNETEAKDLNMVNVSFKVIAIREAHLNKTVLNTAIITKPISREIKQIVTETEVVAVDLSNSEDVAMEGPIIKIARPKRLMKPIHMKIPTIIITIPQVRVEAADLIMVKAETDNFEGLYNEIEAKDLSIVNVSFKIIAIREVHHNKIVFNTAMVVNPISRGIMVIHIEAKAVAVDLSNSEDVVMVGPIIRTTKEHISISITHMTHNQNNMVLPAVYAVDSTIPPSTATRVNMT